MNKSIKMSSSNGYPADYCFCYREKGKYPQVSCKCQLCGEEHLIGCPDLPDYIDYDNYEKICICIPCLNKTRNGYGAVPKSN